jgi:hypothetical protein
MSPGSSCSPKNRRPDHVTARAVTCGRGIRPQVGTAAVPILTDEMTATLLSALAFDAPLPGAGLIISAAAAVVAGIAFFAALYATSWPNWIRADFAIVAVALYAYAFGRSHVLSVESASQIMAYSLGFLVASTLGPLAERYRMGEGGD